jgi:hypothetical protein
VRLHRVYPLQEGAALNDQGGALFVSAVSAHGRIDNPDLYRVLYASADPLAAIAETFARLAIWRTATFVHAAGRPYVLATYDAPDELALFELNDVDALRSIGVRRPSEVDHPDRAVTQGWARVIYDRNAFAGARWWSSENTDWTLLGLWDYSTLTLARPVQILTAENALVRDAAAAIVRQIAR